MSAQAEMNDCEGQGFSSIENGCENCWIYPPGEARKHPSLEVKTRYGSNWWCCPTCNNSYGKVNHDA